MIPRPHQFLLAIFVSFTINTTQIVEVYAKLLEGLKRGGAEQPVVHVHVGKAGAGSSAGCVGPPAPSPCLRRGVTRKEHAIR